MSTLLLLCSFTCRTMIGCFFCFKDLAPTDIYTYGHTLSLHDALPIRPVRGGGKAARTAAAGPAGRRAARRPQAHRRCVPARRRCRRVAARPRSEEHTSELQSLMRISYAVFCLKKKKKTKLQQQYRTSNNE